MHGREAGWREARWKEAGWRKAGRDAGWRKAGRDAKWKETGHYIRMCVYCAYRVTAVTCSLGIEWLDGSWIVCDKHWQLATMGHQVPLMFTLKVCAPL